VENTTNTFLEQFSRFISSCKPSHGRRRKTRFRNLYRPSTFTEKIRRRHLKLSEFFTHPSTKESFIQFTMEQDNEACFPVFDLLTKRSSNGHLLPAVYRKPTHLDRFLNFRSEYSIQHKQSVVNCLFERAKKLSSTAQDLNIEIKHVMKRTLMLNCYHKWMIQN